jgi:hypothetical protein
LVRLHQIGSNWCANTARFAARIDSGLCLVDGTLDLVLQVVGYVLRLVDGVVDMALDLALALLVFALALEVAITLERSEGPASRVR